METRTALLLVLLRASVRAAADETNYTQEMVVRMYADPGLGQRMMAVHERFESRYASSFAVGFSEYYSASSSAILGGGERTHLHLNKLYPGHGATGEWVMQEQVDVKVQEVVMVVEHVNIMEPVIIKLQASAILRDNMVTVFGYVLHLPNNPLPAHLYTSLFYLYTDVRFRRLHTVELVGALSNMAFESPHQQFITLFHHLLKICPRYLTGAVEVWIEALKGKTIDMDKLLRPSDDPLTVDFLSGIEPSVLPSLTETIKFPPQAEHAASPESREVVGPTLSLVMGAIATEVLPLTQPLFALILLHRPVNDMIPQREETERYIVDVLRLGNVNQWDQVRHAVREDLKHGAYAVARAVLYKIYTMKSVDPLIRMKARYILQYMWPPVATYSNPNYEVSSQILSTPSINILMILNAITDHEYSKEVVDIRHRLEHYILKGYINIEFVIKGFNRFDHIMPVNILIAILTRIEVRLSQLPREIIKSLKYLKQILIFKKYLSNLNPTVPIFLTDIEALLSGFSGPTVPLHVTHMVEELVEILPVDKPLPWESIVKKITVRECSLPRLCLMNVFRSIVVTGTVKQQPLGITLTNLVKVLDFEGNPLPEYIVSSELVAHEKVSVETKAVVIRNLVESVHKTSEEEFLDLHELSVSADSGVLVKDLVKYSNHSKTELITQFTKARQPEVLYSPSKTTVIRTSTIYPGPTVKILFTPIEEHILQTEVVDVSKIHLVLPETTIGTPEDMFLRPIRLFLSHPKLHEFLGPHFNVKAYRTKGELLRAVLDYSVSLKLVQFDNVLHSSIIRYKQFLEYSKSMKIITDESIPFPDIPRTFYEQAPNFNDLKSLLPTVKESTPQYFKIKPILELFSDNSLPKLLGVSFDVTKYTSKGQLVIAVLRRSMELHFVREDTLRLVTIRKYIEHVEDSIFTKEEVMKAQFPYLDPIFEEEPAPHLHLEAVLPVTVPGTAIHVRLRPLRKFLSRKDIHEVITGFVVTNYHKKGELLRAIVKHSLTLTVVKSDVKLHTVLKEYWSFLCTSVSKMEVSLTINGNTLVHALPPPKSKHEKDMINVVKHYVTTEEFHSRISRKVDYKVHRTRGVALRMISEEVIKSQHEVHNTSVHEAFTYYKDKIHMHGYGAQGVDLLVTHKPVKKVKFEVYSLFRAVDHNRLTVSVKQSVKRIITFMTTTFEPSVYLHGFEPAKYHTKSNFLQGLFQTLLVGNAVHPEIKADIMQVMPYILTTGPGAEPFHVDLTKKGEMSHIIML